MDEFSLAVDLAREAVLLAVKLALPALAAALIVGVLVGILQAATQVQEQTLSFVPRLAAVALALVLLLPWMLATLAAFTKDLIAGWLR